MITRYYIETAEEHEDIFKAILKDLKENKSKRPMGKHIPDDLDTESDVYTLHKKYSEGVRSEVFTILNFEVPHGDFAALTFAYKGGACLVYKIKEDGTVQFEKPSYQWRN